MTRRDVALDRTPLKPEDWVREATDLLIHRSIDSVRVDVLAKQMNVSRGSFYWHFTDRADLLQRVLLAWKDTQTERIIDRHRKTAVKAEDLIVDLVTLPFHGRAARRGASIELAIRAWARRDAEARRIVDEVDTRRLAYIQECFDDLGFPVREAKSRAFLLYSYIQAESIFNGQGKQADKIDRRKYVATVLLVR